MLLGALRLLRVGRGSAPSTAVSGDLLLRQAADQPLVQGGARKRCGGALRRRIKPTGTRWTSWVDWHAVACSVNTALTNSLYNSTCKLQQLWI